MEDELRIEYTIISRGTERYGSKGYMGISEAKEGKRYFVLAKHYDKYIKSLKDSFCFNNSYSIENIALSRFELISKLALKNKENFINEKIIICGLGNIGFATLMYLLDLGYKNIDILIKNNSEKVKEGIKELNNKYSTDLKLVSKILSYDTYIEATGKCSVIEEIMRNIEPNSTIFLLGTPREENYSISPLEIHRKNINIFGGHELTGHCWEERNDDFTQLLEKNKSKELKKFINIYNETPDIINEVLKRKKNFIEVVKYDI